MKRLLPFQLSNPHTWPRPLRRLHHLVRCLFIYLPRIMLRPNALPDARGSGGPRYISRNPETGEGIGALLCRARTARLLARWHGLTYVHVPFHKCDNMAGDEWETFLGLQAGEIVWGRDLQADALRPVLLPRFDTHFLAWLPLKLVARRIRHTHSATPVLFQLPPFNELTHDQAPALCEAFYALDRERYLAQRARAPMPSVYQPGKVKVAAHIRRGDLVGGIHHQRLVAAEWFARLIDRLNQALGAQRLDIHVFTDATSADAFGPLQAIANLEFHLNTGKPDDAFTAFHAFFEADILICCDSFFSLEAGNLSHGVKILPPRRRHDPPRENWLQADADGQVDTFYLQERFPPTT